jgi:hypothetical protein
MRRPAGLRDVQQQDPWAGLFGTARGRGPRYAPREERNETTHGGQTPAEPALLTRAVHLLDDLRSESAPSDVGAAEVRERAASRAEAHHIALLEANADESGMTMVATDLDSGRLLGTLFITRMELAGDWWFHLQLDVDAVVGRA